MTFAEKLQKLRKQNGLSQEQLAEKLNVSRQAVSKWEMGTIPDMENMIKLGRYFDCSLDYLMNEEMENNTKSQQSPKIENKNLAWKLCCDRAHYYRFNTFFADAIVCKNVSGI